MKKDSKSRLCGDRYEMVNHIINKCSKWTPKNTRLDMTGWELCKRLKFNHNCK